MIPLPGPISYTISSGPMVHVSRSRSTRQRLFRKFCAYSIRRWCSEDISCSFQKRGFARDTKKSPSAHADATCCETQFLKGKQSHRHRQLHLQKVKPTILKQDTQKGFRLVVPNASHHKDCHCLFHFFFVVQLLYLLYSALVQGGGNAKNEMPVCPQARSFFLICS